MKKTVLIFTSLLIATSILIRCTGVEKKEVNEDEIVNVVTPVALPNNIVPGFKFPEDSSVILGWTNNSQLGNYYDSANIYKHAWGIWAGLTAASGQKFAGDDLLVYETWLGLSEIRGLIINNNLNGGCEGVAFKRNGRAIFNRPKQFEHAAMFAGKKSTDIKAFDPETNSTQWVTVSYSPDAACWATSKQLFKQSVINKFYVKGGLGAIPEFPNKSITIKPTYLVFSDTGAFFKMPVWKTAPSPADSNFLVNPNTYDYVFVDKFNKQPLDKVAKPVSNTETDPSKIAAATINLSSFISLKVDKKMASYMNEQDSIQGLNKAGMAKKGQIAILVGMHVTTKEIKNWTWQSYYWTPNPKQPGSPSSDLAASLRPSEIKGAAANYACVAAYVMLTPNNAPNNQATGAMFGYNPYLEGGFGPSVFGYKNTYNKDFKYGVQTNCMSCHALAQPSPSNLYSTDQTIDLKSEYFKDQVTLDFAWSIQTGLINDTVPYWIKKK
jgi:hypothetical protein